MKYKGVRDAFIIAVGDVVVFYASLWVALFFFHFSVPEAKVWEEYLIPFSFLFIIWVLTLSILGLYEKQTIALRANASALLARAHLVNSFLAVVFFYFIPLFSIKPVLDLLIFLAVSFVLLLAWRTLSYILLRSRSSTRALLIGSGGEMKEVWDEINGNPHHRITFISSIDLDEVRDLDLQEDFLKTIYSEEVKLIVVDLRNENVGKLLPHLYNLIFSNIQFVDMQRFYEDVFGKVPISVIQYNWFLENISTTPKASYELLKRAFDIFVASVAGILSLALYPLVYLAVYFEDKGPVFSSAVRMGRNNVPITIWFFRTRAPDGSRPTRVGSVLRVLSLDELPHLWSVVKGDLSLVGPQPEEVGVVQRYEKVLPYYTVRNLLKPGLTGWWAYPEKGVDVADEAALKLSHDLYYIKNRSFFLDARVIVRSLVLLVLMYKNKR